jgi:hypothetical protein
MLPALFHWSPTDRRKQIIRYGLRPGCRPTIGTAKTVTDGRHMICLGTTPSAAWGLSGAMPWACDVDGWDLWQLQLVDTDEVHINPMGGCVVEEVRVANRIPKSRIWWVGSR